MLVADLLESMDLSPVAKEQHPKFGEVWGNVFPEQWQREHHYPDGFDPHGEDEPPRNPEYRPDLSLNLSNRNARTLMATLGYPEAEDYLIPIGEFIARAGQWLQRNLDRPSTPVQTQTDTGEVKPKDNLDFTLLAKKVERETKANHDWVAGRKAFWDQNEASLQRRWKSFEEMLDTLVQRRVAAAVNAERAKATKPQKLHATFVDVGLPEGYLNEKIRKAMTVAQQGREHGATHISVA